jgi:uncharacterized protein
LAFFLLVALPLALLIGAAVLFAPKNGTVGFPHYLAGFADPIEVGIIEATLLLAVTFATAIMAKLERKTLGSYGVPMRLAFGKLFWVGALCGLAAISLAVAIEAVSGGVRFNGLAQHGVAILEDALVWGVAMAIVGLAEESLFRGYIQSTLGASIGFWPAAVVISLLFLGFHLANAGESPLGLGSVVLFGLFFCFTLWLTGNLWFAIGFHAAWDWGMSYLYGVPNSGLAATNNFLRVSPDGPLWVSGGAGGPEASIACFIVVGVTAAFLWNRYRRVRT